MLISKIVKKLISCGEASYTEATQSIASGASYTNLNPISLKAKRKYLLLGVWENDNPAINVQVMAQFVLNSGTAKALHAPMMKGITGAGGGLTYFGFCETTTDCVVTTSTYGYTSATNEIKVIAICLGGGA